MATRSFIGIYDGNAQTAEYVYCHNDGYIDGVGADLINYYNDERTIRALLKKGDLSSLHPEIDTCVFSQLYEASTKIEGVKTINEAFYEMHQPSIEYMYLYDLGSKKWYYVAGTPSKRVKGKVLPQMESSESFASLKDAIAYLNGVLERHNGSLDVTSKRIYMQDGVWGNSYEITIIEKDGSDIAISTKEGDLFKLASLDKPTQFRLLSSLEWHKVERYTHNHKNTSRRDEMKKPKNESIADDSHNLWYSFAEDLEKGMEEQGVYVDIWLNDMGFMEVTEVNEGTTCVIYAKTYQDGGFMSQQLMIEQEDGSFLPGEKFDTGEMPDADLVVPELQWLEPQTTDECNRGKRRTRRESVRTDYEGGFTDTMKAVDAMLTKYYDDGQVEITVTDNGTAIVTVFPKSGEDESITIQLDYANDKATLKDDKGNKKTVSVDVDKPEFDKLGDGIIGLVDAQLGKGKKESRRMRRNEASMADIADDKAAQRYAEVDPKHCSKDEFMSRLKVGDLFVGHHWGTTSYFKVTGFRGGRVVLSSIGKTASGKLVPGVSEPLFAPDPTKAGSEKGAHAQPIKSYSGCELTSREWSFDMWDGKWNFHDINGALGF